MRRRVLIVTAALAVALVAPAGADEKKSGADKTSHDWKANDLVEVELKTKTRVTELGQYSEGEDTRIDSLREVHLIYLERIDRVEAGRVVAVTRHFKKAQLSLDGDPAKLDLEGRSVTSTRVREDLIRSTWTGSELRFGGRNLRVVEQMPWVELRTWGIAQGAREGSIKELSTATWKPGPEVPGFVVSAVEDFLLGTVRGGAWSLALDGKMLPTGTLTGRVKLAGRESEATEEGDYVSSVDYEHELVLTRRVPTAKALPRAKEPPAGEEEDEELPGDPSDEEPMEDEEPFPDDDPVPDEED